MPAGEIGDAGRRRVALAGHRVGALDGDEITAIWSSTPLPR
jgi:hypothetical protein